MMKTIYVVDGARTPFLKAQKGPGPFAASDLATQAGRALLLRQPFLPSDLDEVILGCAAASPDETNIGRMVALRLGCGDKVPGWTVMRNCASGMQALDSAIANIQLGRSELVLAGGVDALSRAPLLYNRHDGALVRRHDVDAYGQCQNFGHFLKLRPPAAAPGDWPDERPDRPGGRHADGPDGGKPGLEIRHQPAADG
jgi:acetyl-CoA C-acetyltransferase